MAKTFTTKAIVPARSDNGQPIITKRKFKAGDPDRSDFIDRWWEVPDDDAYRHVATVIAAVQQRQMPRTFANDKFLRLYSNQSSMGLLGGAMARLRPVGSTAGRSFRFTFNVVESIVDTAHSMISKSQPLPEILSDAGSFKQQKKAKDLTRYLKGKFNELKVYNEGQKAFKDAEIFGTGCVKVFIEDGKICARKVLIDDIIVDEQDGREGRPTQLHQKGHVNRDVLVALFPEHADRIRTAGSSVPGDQFTPVSEALVAVTESWHLPSPGADDGKHIICTDNCTLVAETWARDWYPFAFVRWKDDPIGFYGTGIPQQVAPIQIQISHVVERIAESIDQVCRPTTFVDSRAQIISEHMYADIGSVVTTKGNPQQMVYVVNPTAQPQEVYGWVETMFDKAYALTGVNQLSAQGEKPEGVNSGVALRQVVDIQTGRFEQVSKQYEEMYLCIARMILSLSEELYAGGGDSKVKVADKGFIRSVDWKDASLQDDEYVLQMFPVSALPNYPAGRLQTVTELMQAGLLDQPTGLSLLNFPDLDNVINLQLAGMDDAKATVDAIRWDGDYTPPNPLMDLQTCLSYAHHSYLQARHTDTPDDHMELLTTFISEVQALMARINPPPPPNPVGSATGAPPPPGQSDLMAQKGAGAPPG